MEHRLSLLKPRNSVTETHSIRKDHRQLRCQDTRFVTIHKTCTSKRDAARHVWLYNGCPHPPNMFSGGPLHGTRVSLGKMGKKFLVFMKLENLSPN